MTPDSTTYRRKSVLFFLLGIACLFLFLYGLTKSFVVAGLMTLLFRLFVFFTARSQENGAIARRIEVTRSMEDRK